MVQNSRLMNLQVKYNELSERIYFIENQIKDKQAQVTNFKGYLSQNPDDRHCMMQYRKCMSELNELNNRLVRLNREFNMVYSKMQKENLKLEYQCQKRENTLRNKQMRMMMSQCRKMAKNRNF